MITLTNPFLRFSFDPQTGEWGLASAGAEAAVLEGARVGLRFRAGGKKVEWMLRGVAAKPAGGAHQDRFHGRCRNLAVVADAGHGLSVRIEWDLSAARPFLIWKATVANRGDDPVHIDAIDLCLAGKRYAEGGGVRLPIEAARRSMFVNGWQTWSFAGGLRPGERQPMHRLGPINSAMHVGTAVQSSRRPGHFVSDMFAAIGEASGADALVAGYLAQREQFGVVETRLGEDPLPLRMEADADGVRLDPGRTLATDRAWLALGANVSAAEYFDAAARENRARTRRAPPEGWCTWYYYYTAVRQADVERNTDAAQALRPRLPLRLIQLDDGFQAGVGDWYQRNVKFPSGMDAIAARIRKAGFTPGIWLSPFLIERGSRTAAEHPDWLAPKAQGVMSNIKLAWVRETRSLDVTRPPVMDHVRRLIRTAVKDWKFPFLKLDYLYLPAVKGARLADPTRTRAQALRKALEEIRRAAGEETFLLGCGCPLGSGIGVFDAMRIGPDVDSIWKPHLFHRVWAGRGDPTLPSAWNAVRNTLARSPLHRRWWWNDPDCLLARDSETRLTPDERRTLAAAIALSGGIVLLSDDLTALSPAALRLAQILFPPLYRAAGLPAWRGEAAASIAVLPLRGPQGAWWVVGVFNWSDHPADRFLDVRELTGMREEAAVFSFWDERCLETAGGQLELAKIPAHGSVLLAARPKKAGAQFIGSNLHFSQGAEVAAWKASRKGLRAALSLGREAEGALWLALPGEPTKCTADRRPVVPKQVGERVWKIPVRFTDKGTLVIRWR
jgi:alpha-galactosidase